MTDSANKELKLIEIFRAGKHTDMKGRAIEFTQDDIEAIAAEYDPSLSEAPLVIGHPKTTAPAYGWAKALIAKGGVLFAETHQVMAEFADMVNAGRFKKRSASFFLPDSPGNPKPGKFYLNHIGFLGAAAPAIKGLADCNFSDSADCAEFADDFRWYTLSSIARLFRSLRDHLIDKEGLEAADRVMPDYQLQSIEDAARPANDALTSPFSAPVSAESHSPTEELSMSDQEKADFAAREANLSQRLEAAAAREQALAEREAAALRADAVEFADGLVAGGQLLPKDKAAAVELLLAMPADTTVSFADGSASVSKSAPDLMRDFLSGLPKLIDFSEKSGGDATVIDFADPSAIAAAAVEYQKSEAAAGREISVANAVQHITTNKGSNQ